MRNPDKGRAALPSVPERIQPHGLVEEMERSFLDYSMSVIVHRALPDVRDGLKPVHRRILYAMDGLGLGPRQGYKKSATVVGEVLGKYHPHGDSAVYDAMVRLAQDFAMAHPLVDGQGNFGSVDGDSAAAYRYTEARLSEIATLLLADIDKDTVSFRDNFDGRHREPEVLPARLPNLLVNGSEGIAVGMATKVPPHNLREIGRAIALLCDRPDAGDDEVLRLIRGPDFPTGGILVRTPGIGQFKRTGKGLMTLRGRAHVERGRAGKVSIVFTEIPYGVAKAKILESIAELVRDSRVERKTEVFGKKARRKHVERDEWAEWIAELRDESDREGMRIVVELRKGVDPARVLDRLYAKTALQVTYGARLLALVDGVPRVLPVRKALEIFIAHRLDVVVRRARHDLDRATTRAHVLDGLLVAIANIDRVVKIVRESRKRETAAARLRKEFRLSQPQTEAILNLRLAQLTALDVADLRSELAARRKQIAEIKALLADHTAQRAVVRSETEEIVDRFGRPRRTEIVRAEEAETIMQRAADEFVNVHVSSAGMLRAAAAGERARFRHQDGEVPLAQVTVKAGERAVLFVDGGSAFTLMPEDVEGASGAHVSRIVRGAAKSDRVLWVATPADFANECSVLFVSEQGYVKRTALGEYQAPRAGGVAAVSVAEGDRIVRVLPVTDDQDVILATAFGKAIRFPVSDVPVQGRVARGVIGIKLAKGDVVVSAGMAADYVLVATEKGFGKRVATASFPLQRRAGQGVLLHRPTPKSGAVVCGLPILSSQRVALVGEGGAVHLSGDRAPEAERHMVGDRTFDVPPTQVRYVLPVVGTASARPAASEAEVS